MKKLIIFVCLAIPVCALYARAVQEDYKKADEKARVSYAFGMAIGANLSTSNLEFDYSAFADGLKAALGDAEPQFSEQEAMEIVETALQNAADRKTAENQTAEEEFLAKNRERSEIQVTSSGLQYEVLLEAEGEKPLSNSVVRVHYLGNFIDGRQFDRSEEGEGMLIPMDRVIPGWTEGLMMMSVGSKYKLYIPSNLAYGKDGIQSIIPPYATLIFTVELLEIIASEEEEEF